MIKVIVNYTLIMGFDYLQADGRYSVCYRSFFPFTERNMRQVIFKINESVKGFRICTHLNPEQSLAF